MSLALLILSALALPAALVFLTLSVNDFERNTKALAAALQKRYHMEPPKKAAAPGAPVPPGAAKPGKA